ncbi:hypothetical protein U1Q18_030751, partial [Sarracenia purpurea var. burkii]
ELVTGNRIPQLRLDNAKAIIEGVEVGVQLCNHPVEVLGQLVEGWLSRTGATK